MNRLLMTLVIFFSTFARGSTFIGNGGNAGDLDLSITLGEIHGTFARIEGLGDDLCWCDEDVSDNGVCRILRALTEAQVKICRETLLQYREQALALSSSSSPVAFVLSDDQLKPIDATRSADAIAQPDENRVLIDRRRFLELPVPFRIALLTHEIFHLIPMRGAPLTDDQAVAGFKDGRQFLDTLGAATAMAAHQSGTINDFRRLARVSRGYKQKIFQLDLKSITHSKSAADNLLKTRQSFDAAFTFEYKPDRLGYRVGVDWIASDSPYSLGSSLDLHVSERLTLYSAGIGYHWFPIDAKLSRWSEMHFSCFVDGIYGAARYEVRDQVMTLADQGRVFGHQLSFQAHLPMAAGLWGVIGYQGRNIHYDYRSLHISTKENLQHFFLGGAYAY